MANEEKEVTTLTSLPEVLTTSEVAEVLRVSESHVCRMIKNGKLEKLPLGQRITRVPRSSVNALLGI
jgi:excisionase family DNA binding protein|tara:strand:- start:166 stop:366 length:201 start_codon:yes stop_codon:yes gene_type:complete